MQCAGRAASLNDDLSVVDPLLRELVSVNVNAVHDFFATSACGLRATLALVKRSKSAFFASDSVKDCSENRFSSSSMHIGDESF